MITNLMTKGIQLYHQNKRSFILFSIIGILNTLIYVGFFALFTFVLKTTQFFAITASFILSASFHFIANKIISFQSKNSDYMNSITKYAVLLLINYVISVIIIKSSTWFLSSALLGITITAGVNPLLNYLLFRYWIFSK